MGNTYPINGVQKNVLFTRDKTTDDLFKTWSGKGNVIIQYTLYNTKFNKHNRYII